MTEITYIRSTAVGLAPMTVFCDPARKGCGAGRGSFCQSKGGYQNSTVGFHAARRNAIAHLSEDERYEAYRAMRAEQEERYRESLAAVRQPLTPEQLATRQRINEAWTGICRRQREEEADFRQRCTDEPFPDFRSHTLDCRCRIDGEVQLKPRPKVVPLGTLPVADLNAERMRRRSPRGPRLTPVGGDTA